MDLIAYARVSRARDGRTVSVDNQFKQIEEWCEKQGHNIVARYEDRAFSAMKGIRRPGFEALMSDGRKDVVVWSADRLFRRPVDLEDVVKEGLTIYQVVAGPFDLTTPQGRLGARQMVAFASYEVEQKNERVEVGMKAKFERGEYLGRHRPFGQERDGTWLEPEAAAVRKAAKELASRDTTFYQVAKEWREAGLKTPKRNKVQELDKTKKGLHGGNEWNANSVRVFFTSERLIGRQSYKGMTRDIANWPALLDTRTWEQVQSLIASKKTGNRSAHTGKDSVHVLSGILRCGVCGKGMTTSLRKDQPATATRPARKGGRFYRCATSGHVQVNGTAVEEAVRDDALWLLSRRDDADKEATEFKEQIAQKAHEIRVKEAEFEEWLEEAAVARLKPGLIAKAEESHQAEVKALRGELAMLEAQNAPNLFVAGGWDQAPTVKKRELLRSIYDGIDVAGGQRGKRFSVDRLTFHYTEFGMSMIDRVLADNAEDTSSWAALRGRPPKKGRTYTTNSERMSLEEFFGLTGDMPSKEKEA